MRMSGQPVPDPLFTLRGEMAAVQSLLFRLNDDAEYLYASTQAGIVHKWNLQSCREEFQFTISAEACLSIGFLQDCFISQAKGGEIKIWEERKRRLILKNTVPLDYLGFCRYGISNLKYIVCPESGSKTKIISIEGETIRTLIPSSSEKLGEIMALKCFNLSDKNYIFVLYEGGLLTLFSGDDGREITYCEVSSDCPMALDFDGDSKCVIGGSGDCIVGFELTAGLELRKWKETKITNPGVSCIAIRPDRKLFAAGCWDARVRLFSVKSFKLLAVLVNHKDTIHDICYSPSRVGAWDAQWLLAAAGKDGRVTLWNLY